MLITIPGQSIKLNGNSALILSYERQQQQSAMFYLQFGWKSHIELDVANKTESANISSLHSNCTTNWATVLSRFTAGAQSPISYLGHCTELVQ